MKHELFATLFADRPQDYPYALEASYERILSRIAELWGRPQLNAYLEDLMIDKRGGRQGFPDDVARDIFRIYSLYEALRSAGKAVDPWALERTSDKPEQGYSLRDVGRAIETNDVMRLSAMIDAGFAVDTRLANGWTPLMLATFNASEDSAKLLIERGASVGMIDSENYTPLHWAALNGFNVVVPMLITRGARVNAENRYGFTPLMQAAGRGHANIVRFLVDNGATVNHQDHEGWTALHKAVSNDRLEAALVLLQHGANANLAHKSGVTAADIAKRSKRPAFRRLFGED